MPVSILLCEGGKNSPDVRVIGRLLGGNGEVKPEGSKYGMGNKITSLRKVLPPDTVYGIIDGDFIDKWTTPANRAKDWTLGKDEMYGWRWERKEIENYLIDPVVVAHALGQQAPGPVDYLKALESARDCIAIYQAARIALSVSRISFKAMPSSFGKARGKDDHLFPDAFDKDSCCHAIKEVVEEQTKTLRIDITEVINKFEFYLAECQNGPRYDNYLYAFSGKDLFWAMNKWCADNGFFHASVFKEKILVGIEESTEDISSWLPEWQDLKERINRI